MLGSHGYNITQNDVLEMVPKQANKFLIYNYCGRNMSYSTTDRDECSDGSAQCEHECQNIMSGTTNSYQCMCKKGFSLSEDQHNCIGEVVGNNLKLCPD